MYFPSTLTLLATLLLAPTVLSASNLTTSTTGSCGSDLTCIGSQWGNCCSSNSFCGGNATYCGAGCQSDFGACFTNYTDISPASDGSCGSTSEEKYTCLGSVLGNCCSEAGFCGGNSTYCGAGCQGGYGACGSSAASVAIATTVVGAAATASASSSASATPAPSSSSGLSTGAKAGIGVGVAIVALVAIGLIAFFVLRRRKRSTSKAPYQAEMHAPGAGRGEKQFYDSKIAPSEIGTDGATTGHMVELPASRSHAELPAEVMTERERIARVDDRAAAGYEGAYRGN
jgi:hypothetical protein